MDIRGLRQRTLTFMILSIFVLMFGCSANEPENSKEDKIVAAVTIVPQQTFVEAVCGDLVEVVTLIPPGNSPENYEPTPVEIEKFNKASVYFSTGVAAEEASILNHAGDVKVVALHEKVALVYDDITFESGGRDPHIWLSPKRVKIMIEVIAEEMGKIDPQNKKIYENNATSYISKLNELDNEIRETLADVKNKKFIAYHPAFGYIAQDYGLQMFALEEEGKEATIHHLQDMIDLAEKESIKVIFYQEEIDSSQSRAFAEEIDGRTQMLSPLSADYINNIKIIANTMSEELQ